EEIVGVVGAGPAIQCVGAGPAIQGVVAAVAKKEIVAVKAGDKIVAGRDAGYIVITGRRNPAVARAMNKVVVGSAVDDRHFPSKGCAPSRPRDRRRATRSGAKTALYNTMEQVGKRQWGHECLARLRDY